MQNKHKINTTLLGIFQDNLLEVPYELHLVQSAVDLSSKLKEALIERGIDYTLYNSHVSNSWNQKSEVESTNPPLEIYEYQNFFVLENNGGELILLDGFRRLLWYTPTTTHILVRLYKQADLTNQQILSLLVSLNHFKFFGGGEYHERGFSLLLKTVFDVDITKFKKAFDAYLSSDEIKNSYSSSGKQGATKNNEIKNRIINPHFIEDMRFLSNLKDSNYMCDQYVGALVYKERQNSGKGLDFEKFITLAEQHRVLQDLLGKYTNINTNSSSKSQDVVNKIIEIYNNIFVQLSGGSVEKSFAEKIQECKDLVAKLKKDKNLTKMTGASKCYLIEREIEKRIEKGEVPDFICVVHPINYKPMGLGDRFELPYGMLEGVKYFGMTERGTFKNAELIIGKEIEGRKESVRHNYGGYNSYGKKYTKIGVYDIDLFVNIPSTEIPKR